MRSADPEERVAAADALAEHAAQNLDRYLPALRDALRDPVSDVRLRSVQVLHGAAMTSQDNARALGELTPRLRERLTDSSAAVREAAALAWPATSPTPLSGSRRISSPC